MTDSTLVLRQIIDTSNGEQESAALKIRFLNKQVESEAARACFPLV